jgi:hypothetical protein
MLPPTPSPLSQSKTLSSQLRAQTDTEDTLQYIRSKHGSLTTFMSGLVTSKNQSTASVFGRWISSQARPWLEALLRADKGDTVRTFCHDVTMDDLVREGNHLKKIFARRTTISDTLDEWSLASTLETAQSGAPTVFRAIQRILGIDGTSENQEELRDRNLVYGDNFSLNSYS